MSQRTYAAVLVIGCAFGTLMVLVNGIDLLNEILTGSKLTLARTMAGMGWLALGVVVVIGTAVLFARRRGSNVRSWFNDPPAVKGGGKLGRWGGVKLYHLA